MSEESISPLEQKVKQCMQDFDSWKFNIFHEGEGGGMEGLWYTPADEESYKIASSDSDEHRGMSFKAIILNQALVPFNTWGKEIVLKNNGIYRPEITEQQLAEQLGEKTDVQ